ncbi:MAG: TetR/AcrR family transcriptional regulator [Actinomycetota bacterium]|nr:TetR/AcrR family transcriptional regulator [Actinomycetota bacterium]MDQ2957095.1 TetR/AcrR family transcriptional regulator [Actinomycetota bacterium]
MVYPVNEAFRRQVRERALEIARRLTVERGWQQVRFVEVADEVGVSRPTMYSEFGSKAGLGRALVLAETTAFMTGIVDELAGHTTDLAAAAKSALAYTLVTASENPLLHAVLTNAGDAELLLLLSSQSGPVLPVAVEVLSSWFGEHFPSVQSQLLTELIEALVRLTLSHLIQPTHDLAETLAMLERVTDLVVSAALASH